MTSSTINNGEAGSSVRAKLNANFAAHDTRDEQFQRAVVSNQGGAVAFMFDDGYQSNYLNALPIFKKYGFAATLAVETAFVSANYGGNPLFPMCTPSQLRELIEAGWEVCNHPALNLAHTEAQMVTAVRAENQLLLDYLTGAKNAPGGTAGSVTHPQYTAYPIETAVYQGGARNATSDLAYRYVFDKVRSINGPVATRGDYLYVMNQAQERQMGVSAFPIDTSVNPIAKILAFIEAVAQTNSQAILYGHDTPVAYLGSSPPSILRDELETILKRCQELGVAVVPLRNLYKANAVADKRFDNSSGAFAARAGDTADFVTSDTLHGAARAVRLISSAGVGNDNTYYTTESFTVEPFCRYKVTIRYKIDVDLTLVGGTGNRNHGLNLSLVTQCGNTAGDAAGAYTINQLVLNTAASRLPYQVTSGYGVSEWTLITGWGSQANFKASLYNCSGQVLIGAIYIEKMESLIAMPLNGTSTFNTSLGRLIYLPTAGLSALRGWKWDIRVSAAPIVSSATYNYGQADSNNVTPSNGQTCYVCGLGLNLFAGQSGKLATWNGSAWVFTAIPAGTFFLVSNMQGVANVYVRHIRAVNDGAPEFRTTKANIWYDPPIIQEGAGFFYVFNESGLRNDAFSWYARPVSLAY